jgi:hypothetical protein
VKELIPVLKDRAIFLGWVAGLAIICVMLWSFTYSFRATCLMRSTNKVLISMIDERRLIAPLRRPPASPAPLGCWYSMHNSNSLFFVFTIMREGILVPCGAEISEKGEVTIIPLGSHARQLFERIPQSIIQVYIHRIESSGASIVSAERRGDR